MEVQLIRSSCCLCPVSPGCLLISFAHHVIFLSSCPIPSGLSVLPVSPSLSSLSSMLHAWKVPGLSVRCSIFCRALVAGTVPQKVSRFQLPLLLFAVSSVLPFLLLLYSLSISFFFFFLIFFVDAHCPPLCFSSVLLTYFCD